jgi:hypothetical protein
VPLRRPCWPPATSWSRLRARPTQAILAISEVEHPPLRLLLGTAGYELARAADHERMASDERWRELSVSTDHDGAEAQVEELKRMLGIGSAT